MNIHVANVNPTRVLSTCTVWRSGKVCGFEPTRLYVDSCFSRTPVNTTTYVYSTVHDYRTVVVQCVLCISKNLSYVVQYVGDVMCHRRIRSFTRSVDTMYISGSVY
jgi:hypothetical protein